MSNPIEMTKKDYQGPGTGYYDDMSSSDIGSYWNQLFQNVNDQPMNVFDSWFNSEMTANRDFARQMVGQMYQNWYESAPEQMKRLKEAGINPNFAAGAVAGNAAGASPMSAPQTDSNNPLADIAGVGNAITGAVDTASQLGVNESIAGVNRSTAKKLDTETDIIGKKFDLEKTISIGQLAKDLMTVGVGELEAAMIAFDVGDGGNARALEYFKSAIGVRQFDKQLEVLDKELAMRQKQIDKYDELIASEVNVNNKTALKNEKDAAKAELDAWYLESKKKLYQDIPYMALDPVNMLLYLRDTYGVHSPQYENAVKSLQDFSYRQNLGKQNALIDTAYEAAFNAALGTKQVDIDYQAYEKLLSVIGNTLESFYKGALENPDNLQELISTYLNDLVKSLKSLGIDFSPISTASKPYVSPKQHYR